MRLPVSLSFLVLLPLMVPSGCETSASDRSDPADSDRRPVEDTGRPPPPTEDAGADIEDAAPETTEPTLCLPNGVRCASEFEVETCSDDGEAWLPAQRCPNRTLCRDELGCVEVASCRPGTATCLDVQTRSVCDETGTTRRPEPCGGERTCWDGRCVVDACDPDAKNYLGCEFWATHLENLLSGRPLYVTVGNANPYDVDVEITDFARRRVVQDRVAAGAVLGFAFSHLELSESGISDRTARLTTSAPVTVHQFNPRGNTVRIYSNDASLLLPRGALGRDYIVLGWPTVAYPDDDFSLRASVTIVAREDDTRVEITSPVPLAGSPSIAPVDANAATEFELAAGQVLHLRTTALDGADLTGLRVRASRDVAVFSAHACANVPIGVGYCDHMEQQLVAVPAWSSEYVGIRFAQRGDESTLHRIVAAHDGTVVRTTPPIDGVDGTTLNSGESIEFPATSAFHVQATRPILAGAFMVGAEAPRPGRACHRSGSGGPAEGIEERDRDGSGCAIAADPLCSEGNTAIGDPAFLLLVGVDQQMNRYRLTVPADYREDWLTLVWRDGTSIELDGAPIDLSAGERVGGTDWRTIDLPVRPGVRALDADQPIAAYVYGYDCNVSYAYPGGLTLP